VGYVVGHYPVALQQPDPTLSVASTKKSAAESPSVAGVCGPVHIQQPGLGQPTYVKFYPSVTSHTNFVCGAINRLGRKMPQGDDAERKNFLDYGKKLILDLFPHKLRIEDIPSDCEYFDHLNQTASRIKSLRDLRSKMEYFEELFGVTKAHIKNEGWMEPKAPRIICSPSDESKVTLGPLIHAADRRMFGLDERSRMGFLNPGSKFFVKGTDPKDWPARLRDTFGNTMTQGTDFTSFEAHHRGELATLSLFWILHMIHDIPEIKPLRKLIAKLLTGYHRIENKQAVLGLADTLMSGSLWTSSANGMLNFCLISYLTQKSKYPTVDNTTLVGTVSKDFKGIFEGDDGLSEYVVFQPGLIDRLGILLKPEPPTTYEEAGFCRIFCDSHDQSVVKNPKDVLSQFFVLPTKYKDYSRSKLLSLQRARALSYMYNFGRSPIIASLCRWVLRRTRSFTVTAEHAEDSWHIETLKKAIKEKVWMKEEPVSDTSRALVEKLFGVGIEMQLRIERAFDSCQDDVCDFDLSDWLNSRQLNHALSFVQERGSLYVHPHLGTDKALDTVMSAGVKSTMIPKRNRSVEKRWRLCKDSVGLMTGSMVDCA